MFLTDAANIESSPGEEKIQKEIETIDYIDKWVNAQKKVQFTNRTSN